MNISDIINADDNSQDQKTSKKNLLEGFSFQENLLEGAVERTIITLKQKIEELEKRIENVLAVLETKNNGEEDFIFKEGLHIFNDYRHLHNEQGSYKDELLALNEVRVIYRFKNIEISLKNLIKKAYPNSNVKDLFRWENMINFFKQKEINIQKIPGFEEVDQLRKLNNSLKHSNIFDEEASKTPEFTGADFDINTRLDDFLMRILPKILIFQNGLIEEVKKELYTFDDNRLDRMANELYSRMNKQDAAAFTAKLKSKYIHKSQ